MKFGVITPNLNSPRKLVEFAKAAEEADFDHLLLRDHYYMEEYHDMLDHGRPLVILPDNIYSEVRNMRDPDHFSSPAAPREDRNNA